MPKRMASTCRAISVGSPRAVHVSRCVTAALLQSATVSRKPRSAAASRPAAFILAGGSSFPLYCTVPLLGSKGCVVSRTETSVPSASQTRLASILPWVSVPVLSEQMLVTPPTASSAASLRTITLPLAMALVPSAVEMVSTAIRDSGITATATQIP